MPTLVLVAVAPVVGVKNELVEAREDGVVDGATDGVTRAEVDRVRQDDGVSAIDARDDAVASNDAEKERSDDRDAVSDSDTVID